MTLSYFLNFSGAFKGIKPALGIFTEVPGTYPHTSTEFQDILRRRQTAEVLIELREFDVAGGISCDLGYRATALWDLFRSGT